MVEYFVLSSCWTNDRMSAREKKIMFSSALLFESQSSSKAIEWHKELRSIFFVLYAFFVKRWAKFVSFLKARKSAVFSCQCDNLLNTVKWFPLNVEVAADNCKVESLQRRFSVIRRACLQAFNVKKKRWKLRVYAETLSSIWVTNN